MYGTTQTRHDLVLPAALAPPPAISPLLIQFQPPGVLARFSKHANFTPVSESLLLFSRPRAFSLEICVRPPHFIQVYSDVASSGKPSLTTRVNCHLPWTPYPFTLFVFITAITK